MLCDMFHGKKYFFNWQKMRITRISCFLDTKYEKAYLETFRYRYILMEKIYSLATQSPTKMAKIFVTHN